MLVRLTRRERGKVTGDLFTSTGLAATERVKRSVVNKVVGNISGSRICKDLMEALPFHTPLRSPEASNLLLFACASEKRTSRVPICKSDPGQWRTLATISG